MLSPDYASTEHVTSPFSLTLSKLPVKMLNKAEHFGSTWRDLLQVIMAPSSSSFRCGHLVRHGVTPMPRCSFLFKCFAAALACSVYSCPLIYQLAEHSRKENAINLGGFFFFSVNGTGSSLETAEGMWFFGTKALSCTRRLIHSVTPSPVWSICLTACHFSLLSSATSISLSRPSLKVYPHLDEG